MLDGKERVVAVEPSANSGVTDLDHRIVQDAVADDAGAFSDVAWATVTIEAAVAVDAADTGAAGVRTRIGCLAR